MKVYGLFYSLGLCLLIVGATNPGARGAPKRSGIDQEAYRQRRAAGSAQMAQQIGFDDKNFEAALQNPEKWAQNLLSVELIDWEKKYTGAQKAQFRNNIVAALAAIKAGMADETLTGPRLVDILNNLQVPANIINRFEAIVITPLRLNLARGVATRIAEQAEESAGRAGTHASAAQGFAQRAQAAARITENRAAAAAAMQELDSSMSPLVIAEEANVADTEEAAKLRQRGQDAEAQAIEQRVQAREPKIAQLQQRTVEAADRAVEAARQVTESADLWSGELEVIKPEDLVTEALEQAYIQLQQQQLQQQQQAKVRLQEAEDAVTMLNTHLAAKAKADAEAQKSLEEQERVDAAKAATARAQASANAEQQRKAQEDQARAEARLKEQQRVQAVAEQEQLDSARKAQDAAQIAAAQAKALDTERIIHEQAQKAAEERLQEVRKRDETVRLAKQAEQQAKTEQETIARQLAEKTDQEAAEKAELKRQEEARVAAEAAAPAEGPGVVTFRTKDEPAIQPAGEQPKNPLAEKYLSLSMSQPVEAAVKAGAPSAQSMAGLGGALLAQRSPEYQSKLKKFEIAMLIQRIAALYNDMLKNPKRDKSLGIKLLKDDIWRSGRGMKARWNEETLQDQFGDNQEAKEAALDEIIAHYVTNPLVVPTPVAQASEPVAQAAAPAKTLEDLVVEVFEKSKANFRELKGRDWLVFDKAIALKDAFEVPNNASNIKIAKNNLWATYMGGTYTASQAPAEGERDLVLRQALEGLLQQMEPLPVMHAAAESTQVLIPAASVTDRLGYADLQKIQSALGLPDEKPKGNLLAIRAQLAEAREARKKVAVESAQPAAQPVPARGSEEARRAQRERETKQGLSLFE